MATNCTPVYGTGSAVGWVGSAARMAFRTNSANGAALVYWPFSYVDRRVPGGTTVQPSLSPTNFTYSFDVAHFKNCLAASTCFEEVGMASPQDQAQPAPLATLAVGAFVNPVLS